MSSLENPDWHDLEYAVPNSIYYSRQSLWDREGYSQCLRTSEYHHPAYRNCDCLITKLPEVGTEATKEHLEAVGYVAERFHESERMQDRMSVGDHDGEEEWSKCTDWPCDLISQLVISGEK